MSLLDIIGLVGSLITIGYLVKDVVVWVVGRRKPTDSDRG